MPALCLTSFERTISVPTGAPLIEIGETEDLGVLFGCRQGVCGACLVSVRENPDNLSPMGDDERDFLAILGAQPCHRLACQCRVLGDVSLQTVGV